MKTLIIYYSRNGHTRTIAQELATKLQADIEEIHEIKSRTGIIGWLLAGRDAAKKTITKIKPTQFNLSNYELVIIGTPVWAFTMSSGIRTWLTQFGKQLKQVAFFATMGGKGDTRTFKHMEELCSNPPIATASFIDKQINKNMHQESLDAFIKALQ